MNNPIGIIKATVAWTKALTDALKQLIAASDEAKNRVDPTAGLYLAGGRTCDGCIE